MSVLNLSETKRNEAILDVLERAVRQTDTDYDDVRVNADFPIMKECVARLVSKLRKCVRGSVARLVSWPRMWLWLRGPGIPTPNLVP